MTVTIDFVNWLTAEQISLAGLDQGHIDKWVATGPATRLVVGRFLTWARKARLVPPDLSVPRHRRGGSSKLSAAEQETAVQRVVHTDELSSRDRAAAILVIDFGQQIEKVAELTWDDVTVTDAIVTVRLGGTEIAIQSPSTGPGASWQPAPETIRPPRTRRATGCSAATRPAGMCPPTTSAISCATSSAHGQPGSELCTSSPKLAPIAIIAEMLGYSPATIERHAIASAACEPCLPEWHARDTGHLDHRHAVFGAPAQRLRADARDMLVQQPQASPFPVRLSPVP